MKKYRCQICGYIYDDAKERIKFEDLPADWTCPLCGAPKSMFEEITEPKEKVTTEPKEVANFEEVDEDMRSLSAYEIAYICSNLAKGCEKQYMEEEQALFQELADYYEQQTEEKSGTFNELQDLVNKEASSISVAMEVANHYEDRGAKRVLTWASKTTNVMKMILEKYAEHGIEYLKNTKIWVCDICGFIFVGDTPPVVCPICKVPSFKILEVK